MSNKSNTPFYIKMLIDFLERAKWTRARVANCFTERSWFVSLHRVIISSITPFLIISSKRFSLYVNKLIASTAFDLIVLGNFE